MRLFYTLRLAFLLVLLLITVGATVSYTAPAKLSSLTNEALILEDRTASSGFPDTGLYIKGRDSGISPQFYIGYPPTTSYTTASTPPVLLTGQESDQTLLMFSLNNQAMTAFRSDFDGNNNSANKLHIDSRGTPIMTITGKGYVGIGNENPAGFLDIAGDMYVNGEVYALTKISDLATDNRSLAMAFSNSSGDNIATSLHIFNTSPDNPHRAENPNDIYTFQFPSAAGGVSSKSFVIPHPQDKERYLVHAALEGPENGVRYRGVVQLKEGKGHIVLPEYVQAFTDPDTATLHLYVANTGESVRAVYKKGKWLRNGHIFIESENKVSEEEVSWTLQVTRTDITPLTVTPPKNIVHVDGIGPYKIVKGKRY